VTKIDAVIIAVEKAKTAVSAKTPTVHSQESIDNFDVARKDVLKSLGYVDGYLANAKAATKKVAVKLKA
jgi:hypothetical protein